MSILQSSVAAALLLASGALAAASCPTCVGQHVVSQVGPYLCSAPQKVCAEVALQFEYSPHGGAYFQPFALPGLGDGLNWGLSGVYTQTDIYGDYCDRICAATIPNLLSFAAKDDPANNYVNAYTVNYPQIPAISTFSMASFYFGCTRTGKYKQSNGTVVTTEIPVKCQMDVNTGYDVTVPPDFTYVAHYTPKIQVNDYTGLPYAQPVFVSLPSNFNNTVNMWFNATASAKKDSTIKVYLDSFDHTNYYCASG